MPRRRIAAVLLALLLAPILVLSSSITAQPEPYDGQPDQVELRPDPQAGMEFAEAGFDYVSPPTEAPRPFTHLLLRREASVPPGAAVVLQVRASTDGSDWSPWLEVGENHDLWEEADGPDVLWSNTLDAGTIARFWQVRAFYVPASDGAMPELRSVQVNTVDAAVSMPPPLPQFDADPLAAGRPPVVSRTGWGCPDGQGSRVPPDHYPVNHLVVHHTADSNSLYPTEPNWAARVRAEWSFHTFTRGWGDVGYNFLIDPNGVIYEGRAGGDDAVGFHDKGNYGSMGVVLIGTFSSVEPLPSAKEALVRLLGWKAGQKGIDPLGRSFYYGCSIARDCYSYNPGSVVANIAGHRQVLPGHTTCPGDRALELLPGIRARVHQLLNSGGGGVDTEIDDLEPGFSRSDANWHDAGCGAGEHSYYTFATDNPAESSNSATWRPNLPSAGLYRVYVAIPQRCNVGNATGQATYTIAYAGGNTTRVVDQRTADDWVDLGVYPFPAGSEGAVSLSDLTGEPFAEQRPVFFDAVKWVPDNTDATIELQGVNYDWPGKAEGLPLAAGDLLKISFTVRNLGSTTLAGQAPRADTRSGGQNDAYVYDQGECFVGDSAGTYPAFPKEANRFRVTLGSGGWDVGGSSCAGPTSDYPWRWGLADDLSPGRAQTVVGYVRFREPGDYPLRAGVVQEYVRYHSEGVGETVIPVGPERSAPIAPQYDEQLRPMAQVYRLGAIPDNLLTRTANALSVPRGEWVGSFAWDGAPLNWGAGGPFGLNGRLLVEQVRSFIAPISGEYTFRAWGGDGAWLWIDGRLVAVTAGSGDSGEATGSIGLEAGVHVLSIKFFDRGGTAPAGYAVRMPGAESFGAPLDGLGGASPRLGRVFYEPATVFIAADDQGGSGVSRVRWSLNGAEERETEGGLIDTGRLANGDYVLQYQAFDGAGNAGPPREVSFTVNDQLPITRAYAPVAGR